MKKRRRTHDHRKDVKLAPELQALVGKTVDFAVESDVGLLVCFTDGSVLDARGIPTGETCEKHNAPMYSLSFKLGTIKPDGRERMLEEGIEQNMFTAMLPGRMFEDLDGNVLVFSGNIGAQLVPDGIEWVRALYVANMSVN